MKNFFPLMLVLAFSINATAGIAAYSPFNEKSTLVKKQWQAKYAGPTFIDNVSVLAVFEVSQQEISLPMQTNTILPMKPVYKKVYRVHLISTEQPKSRISVALKLTKISTEAGIVNAFVSDDIKNDFQFTIYEKNDGTLQANYRRVLSTDHTEENSFTMNPLFTTL